VLVKLSPSAAWAASRLTVCGELTVVILKLAISLAPGLAAGFGVVAFVTSDQGVTLFQVEPVPSQRIFIADAASNSAPSPRHNARQNARNPRLTLIVLSPRKESAHQACAARRLITQKVRRRQSKLPAILLRTQRENQQKHVHY